MEPTDSSNGYSVSSNTSGGFTNPFVNTTTPTNYGGFTSLYSTAGSQANSTAQVPGAAQQANSNISDIVNAGSLANKGYNYLSNLSSNPNSFLGNFTGQATDLGITSGGGDVLSGGAGVASDTLGGSIGSDALESGSSIGSFFSSNAGFLGGQAFGADGFLGSLGSSTLDGIGSSIANAGAGFLGSLGGNAVFGGGGDSNIGATVGGIAGSYLGPVGTLVGSFIGSGIGSLFGGDKQPNPAGMYSGTTINADGSLSGGGLSSGKHVTASNFSGYVNDFSSYLKNQTSSLGLSTPLTNATLGFGYDVNGTDIPNGNKKVNSEVVVTNATDPKQQARFSFDPTDDASKQAAYQQAFNQIATYNGIDPSTLKAPSAQNVTIDTSQQNQPSDWDKFIAQYRADHPGSTPTTQA